MIGDIRIVATPFLGEQPTDACGLYPEIRNLGNTYFVQTPFTSAVFLADAGRDDRGATDEAVRNALGDAAPDAIFAGYRGWSLYPFQYLVSSVPRYFLFVPPSLWGVRQQTMLSAEHAVDTAERLKARALIPYADGGARGTGASAWGPAWMERGTRLRPRGSTTPPSASSLPALHRSTFPDGTPVASPVNVALMRPNQTLRLRGVGSPATSPRIRSITGQDWPYPHPAQVRHEFR